MKETIWKFPLPLQTCARIEMPEGAEILAVADQFDLPHLWVKVRPDAPRVTRMFEMFGTGHELPELDKGTRIHIGTFLTDGGNYVFHVFELLA